MRILIKANVLFKIFTVDLVSEDEEFLDGFAHRGMLRGAKRIMAESLTKLQSAIDEHPGYRLVITGHSLGAGTAILITMGLLNNFWDLRFAQLKCVALAPPPVFRSQSPISNRYLGSTIYLKFSFLRP